MEMYKGFTVCGFAHGGGGIEWADEARQTPEEAMADAENLRQKSGFDDSQAGIVIEPAESAPAEPERADETRCRFCGTLHVDEKCPKCGAFHPLVEGLLF